MVLYRRNRVAGGCYFFTVTLFDRRARVLIEHIDALRVAWSHARERWPFETTAVCVLPDHLHTVWTLPGGDDDYASRWRAIKARFTAEVRKRNPALQPDRRGEYRLWQRRYWEHTIRDDADLRRHIDYLHYNPVRHGLTARVRDWPHSSFRKFVGRGVYPIDWGDAPRAADGDEFGERNL